jgi:integrase/recombinase XerD
MPPIYLPQKDWPQRDQNAWLAATHDGDILDGRGPAFHWAAATRVTNIEHYGRWLSFLARQGSLSPTKSPASRVTRITVKAYVKAIKVTIAPRTVVSSLVGLKVMMKAMVPDQDWQWLADICNRLNRNAKPSRDKQSKMLSSTTIYWTAIKRLRVLSKTDLSKRTEIVGFRNSLMLALMTACPLRLKNFSSLTLGSSFKKADTGWAIKICGTEVKNGQPMMFDVPVPLLGFFKRYLEQVRPRIAKGSESALWVAWDGDRLESHSTYIAFTRITTELFGKAINPHLLRDCAATTMASDSYAGALAARGLLGHKRFSTTERFYIHAKQLEASRKINTILAFAAKAHP